MSDGTQVALVTGAGRGIGRATCLRLATAGFRIVAVARTQDEVEDTAAAVRDSSGQAVAAPADVVEPGAVASAVQTTLEAFGRLDVLVNNAGFYQSLPFGEITTADWDRMLAVHLTGTFLCCQAAVPAMLRQGSGSIVNVASTSGLTGGTSGAHYAAAKGGVIAFTRALARELAPKGVRVNAVAPSKVQTDILAQAVDEPGRAELVRSIPVGHVGQPEEIAEVIAFLASPRASYVVGEVVVASGGYR